MLDCCAQAGRAGRASRQCCVSISGPAVRPEYLDWAIGCAGLPVDCVREWEGNSGGYYDISSVVTVQIGGQTDRGVGYTVLPLVGSIPAQTNYFTYSAWILY